MISSTISATPSISDLHEGTEISQTSLLISTLKPNFIKITSAALS